jgi:hypothetical protein
MISFGVVASRVRRQEKRKIVMLACTVACSRIIGFCFQFNDLLVVKRGHNEIQKLAHCWSKKRRDYAHNHGNLIPVVATTSILT